MLVWLKALRVSQWTKNAVVMAAWFFAFADVSQAVKARSVESFLYAIGMVGAFCLVSSSFYLLNDVSDYDADRLHPVKSKRPVAADLISKIDAVRAALVLFAVGMTFPAMVLFRHPERTLAFGMILAYTVLQCLYSGMLKHIPYVDVLIIASGFVLRAVSGAAVIDARISPWLLACAFSLAFFIALCKRRHEKVYATESRKALAGYHLGVLDVMIVFSAVLTLGVYLGYTTSADTIARFHTRALSFTAIFVALGIARYLVLLWGRADVGRPEKIVLSDKLLWLVFLGYGFSSMVCVWVR